VSKLRISDLFRPNPIAHKSLTLQQQDRARTLLNKIQDLNICKSFEQWELGFLRAKDPEEEIKAWEWILAEFEKDPLNRNLDTATKKKAVNDLLLLSAFEFPLR
jgi:hypothetical protein